MNQDNLKSVKVGFIGGGNMASAIGVGLIRKGVLDPKNIWVSGRTDKTLEFWRNLGTHATSNNGEVVQNTDIIFLTIKPNMLDTVIKEIRDTLGKPIENKLYVSVLVGITLNALKKRIITFDPAPRIIRSMPNTPLTIGEGITVYCGMDTNEKDTLLIDKLFSSIGISENVPESLMSPIGSLSGSGPAYAYLIIESMADGAAKMGVPRAMATKFAAQVLVGAGKMVLETGRHPGQLKDEVCSPGGSTICGVHAMECGQVRGAMMNAIEAGAKRSAEISSSFLSD